MGKGRGWGERRQNKTKRKPHHVQKSFLPTWLLLKQFLGADVPSPTGAFFPSTNTSPTGTPDCSASVLSDLQGAREKEIPHSSLFSPAWQWRGWAEAPLSRSLFLVCVSPHPPSGLALTPNPLPLSAPSFSPLGAYPPTPKPFKIQRSLRLC